MKKNPLDPPIWVNFLCMIISGIIAIYYAYNQATHSAIIVNVIACMFNMAVVAFKSVK